MWFYTITSELCVHSTTTSVRSGNTLLNQLTVKRPSPLWGRAVDKQLVLGSCQTWNLFVYRGSLSSTHCISSCTLRKLCSYHRVGKSSSSRHLLYDSTLGQREYADQHGKLMKFNKTVILQRTWPHLRGWRNCDRCLKPTATVAK